MQTITKINIKQYTVDSNIQLFLDSTKVKFKTFQSDSLRDALKYGRSLSIGAEKTKFENDLRSIKKKLKLDFNSNKTTESTFDMYINFIGMDLLLAYNSEHRFSVLITKNGTKTTRLYTSPMKAASTKTNNADYFDFTFNTDRIQKDLDECSRLGILKTMSRQEKESQRYDEYCEYKAMAEMKVSLSTLTSDQRIQFFIDGLNAEFGSSNIIKHLAMREANKTEHSKVIISLNAVIADVKRSETQKKNAEAKVLNNEGSTIEQFKSVMPTPPATESVKEVTEEVAPIEVTEAVDEVSIKDTVDNSQIVRPRLSRDIISVIAREFDRETSNIEAWILRNNFSRELIEKMNINKFINFTMFEIGVKQLHDNQTIDKSVSYDHVVNKVNDDPYYMMLNAN